MGLDAGMQQPTACRKYEGDRVRRVAPKLIANGESHALRSREAAQLGASGLGSHVAVKSTRGWRGGRRTGRRRRATAERHAEKITVKREAKGDARVLPECQQGTMEESTWADSMDSVCEGGAVCACSDRTDAHVEHGERRSAPRSSA